LGFWILCVGFIPKFAGGRQRINARVLPPSSFVANAMNGPMMRSAQGHGEFVANLLSESAWLDEPDVVRIGRFSPAQQTGLLPDKSQMIFVALPGSLG
jgi:hypothetical protein